VKHPAPTPEMLAALQAFRARHGRTWKDKLMTMWLTGRDANEPQGHLLRQVRNRLGPSWLAKLKLEDE
jgi:hypothetical protein